MKTGAFHDLAGRLYADHRLTLVHARSRWRWRG